MVGKGEILVGVDGSQHSDAAVIWTAGEAASRGCGLMVVHAFDASSTGIWATTAAIRSDLRAMSQGVVDDALRLAAQHQPGVPVAGCCLAPRRVPCCFCRRAWT
jgi:nucleotide-binding universal stress UspA family protein